MVKLDSDMTFEWLEAAQLQVEEFAPGEPERVLLYFKLLVEHPDEDTDPIVVARRGDRYIIKNGRHRWMAHVLAGRPIIGAVVIHED